MTTERQLPKATIIIISTDPRQTHEATDWIGKQTIRADIELLILNNENNSRYVSAAQALNEGARHASSDILIFMHQDVYLWDPEAVNKTVEFLNHGTGNVIVGAAGVCKSDKTLHTDIYGKNKKRFAPLLGGKTEEAISLDECFFAMRKSVWEELKFDEATCDNWHFYGVDICYTNLLNGGQNFVLPLEICHESDGNPNSAGFRKSLKKMIKKYRKHINYLLTPVVQLKCSMLQYRKYCLKTFLIRIGFLRVGG